MSSTCLSTAFAYGASGVYVCCRQRFIDLVNAMGESRQTRNRVRFVRMGDRIFDVGAKTHPRLRLLPGLFNRFFDVFTGEKRDVARDLWFFSCERGDDTLET